jgi:hypothetical protein
MCFQEKKVEESQIDRIINHYPYPVAVLYRIIAGMNLDDEPDKGLAYILQTAEAIARLLGMITLAELLDFQEKNNVKLPPAITSEFKKNIRRPSFGIWLGFAREGLRFLKSNNTPITIPEMENLFYQGKQETPFKQAIDILIKVRNALAHGKMPIDTKKNKLRAVNVSRTYLDTALAELEFFEGISFGYINTIEVEKKRRQEPVFHHKGKTLQGGIIGKGINLNSEQAYFKETNTVIVQYDTDNYLDLYPFYIYDESNGDAADVFYYNGMEGKQLEYIGIDPGGKLHVENKTAKASLTIEEELGLMFGEGAKVEEDNLKCSRELFAEFDHIKNLLG